MRKTKISVVFLAALLISMSFAVFSQYASAATTGNATNTSISFSPDPTNANTTTTVTATVTGSTPTGTITWETNCSTGTFNATSTTLTLGTSTVTYTDAQPGNVTITAIYSGDQNNSPSSQTVTIRIYPVGDFFHTGVINFQDTMYMVAAYITAQNGGPVNPACDLNHDGKINFADLKIYVYDYENQL